MKNILSLFTLLLATTLIFSCQKKAEIKPAMYTFPEVLSERPEIKETFDKMALIVGELNASFGSVAAIAEGKDVKSSDELSGMQKLKLGKSAIKIMKLQAGFENCCVELKEISKELNPEQALALDETIRYLQIQMGMYGADDKTLAERVERKAKEKEFAAEVEQMRADAIAAMPEEDRALYEAQEARSQSNSFKWWHLLFPVLVIGLILFAWIRRFKKAGSLLQDIGHSYSQSKETVSELLSNPEKITGEKRDLSEDEQEQLKKMQDFFNKH